MLDSKRPIQAWVMYDWANSAFATTIAAVLLPIFYQDIAAIDLPDYLASAYWGYTLSAAMLIVVLLAPLMGAIADYSRTKKQHLITLALVGIAATALLATLPPGAYRETSLLFILATIGFSGANVFYDAFLPEITKPKERNFVSAKGFAFGYLGGGLLLSVNILMVQFPHWFGLSDTLAGMRLAFLSASCWWLLFSVPLIRNLREAQDMTRPKRPRYIQAVKAGLVDVQETLRNIVAQREILKFLLAFWLYNDAIGTLIGMAAVFGREIGLSSVSLMGALLMTQFLGFPFTLLFGKYANLIGTKNSLYVYLGVYLVATVFSYFMTTPTHFFMLALLVSTSLGASQAMSRSLFSMLIPVGESSAKYFSFYSVFSKMRFLAPAVFAFVGHATGNSRNGVLALVPFLVAGVCLLYTVNIVTPLDEDAAGSRVKL